MAAVQRHLDELAALRGRTRVAEGAGAVAEEAL
jgi:hypothetical protein